MTIPTALYTEVQAVIPIPCVDILIRHQEKFLLLRRLAPPQQGKWWTPGGRVLKGETQREAVRRKTHEETGLEVNPCKVWPTSKSSQNAATTSPLSGSQISNPETHPPSGSTPNTTPGNGRR